MTDIIDNIELDKNNAEFYNAAEFVRHTDKLVYLTGKAGTGKTTFLKYIKEITEKNTVILAPTGVAAINAGGVTIHSFFQVNPKSLFLPNDPRLRTKAGFDSENRETIFSTFRYREDKLETIKKLELLIIDEVSMVRVEMLDLIDQILRIFRRKGNLPFGGVQVILIGDTFQLPPIADNQVWTILSQFYKTPFFFSAKVFKENTPIYIELKKIYRQNEQEFIDLLNRVRVNNLNQADFNILNSKYNPNFSGEGSDYIILATHNIIARETNLTKLRQLETELFTFEAKMTGTFPDKHKPTDHDLRLKVGSQVMFVKNDQGNPKRYYNGKIGTIKELEEDLIRVIFDDESEVDVKRTVWNNIQYTYNPEKKKVEEIIIGTFEQFPIRLAWAITVHKSQGLTFEKVIADLGSAFAPGQVYVALSRCTSFNGLQLSTRLSQYAIKTDPRVLEFAKTETPGTLITKELNTGKADFYYKKAREQFRTGDIKSSFDFFKRALKFRNDIDTENFERFIVIQASRLWSFYKKYKTLQREKTKLNHELIDANQTIENYSKKISEKTKKITSQNSSITFLQTKSRELENENQSLKIKLNSLERSIIDYEAKLAQIESKLKNTEQILDSKNKENESNKVEIKRLKNLKWYDKLLGSK